MSKRVRFDIKQYIRVNDIRITYTIYAIVYITCDILFIPAPKHFPLTPLHSTLMLTHSLSFSVGS